MDNPTATPSLREVMARYPTGVTVVAACDPDAEPYGLTVNSFASVSLDPPLILVCIGHSSSAHERLVSAETFTVNILAADQGAVAMRFANDPSDGRFEGVDWMPSESGDPILDGVVAWIGCSVDRILEGGDHSIVLGRVRSSGMEDREALLFHRGHWGSTEG